MSLFHYFVLLFSFLLSIHAQNATLPTVPTAQVLDNSPFGFAAQVYIVGILCIVFGNPLVPIIHH
jgi:hypothetical protein